MSLRDDTDYSYLPGVCISVCSVTSYWSSEVEEMKCGLCSEESMSMSTQGSRGSSAETRLHGRHSSDQVRGHRSHYWRTYPFVLYQGSSRTDSSNSTYLQSGQSQSPCKKRGLSGVPSWMWVFLINPRILQSLLPFLTKGVPCRNILDGRSLCTCCVAPGADRET